MFGVTSAGRSLMEKWDFVDWTFMPRLLSVRGVADIIERVDETISGFLRENRH